MGITRQRTETEQANSSLFTMLEFRVINMLDSNGVPSSILAKTISDVHSLTSGQQTCVNWGRDNGYSEAHTKCTHVIKNEMKCISILSVIVTQN